MLQFINSVIFSFCGGMPAPVLASYAARIAVDLGPLLLVTVEDTLSLILETIASVVDISYGNWITPDIAQGLVNVVLDVWKRNDQGNGTHLFTQKAEWLKIS